jgi:DNA-binding beta-propeller fold protein YncE
MIDTRRRALDVVAINMLFAAPASAQLLSYHAAEVRTGLAPSVVAIDRARETAYTGDLLSNTVTVVDLRRCWIGDVSGCPSAAVAAVGVGLRPDGLGLDETTGTLYVANSGDATVSVVDVRRCVACDTSGCMQVPATVQVGPNPGDVAVDSERATAYVTNSGSNTLSVIDLRHCRAGDTTGCSATPATVTVGLIPAQPAFDPTTRTVYASLLGEASVAVVDARRCFADDTSGCSQLPARVPVGLLPAGISLVPELHTAYVANEGSGTVSMIDLRRCHAADTSGCSQAATPVVVGLLPDGTSPDSVLGVVYVSDVATATVSVFSMIDCRAGATAGCSDLPSFVLVGLIPFAVLANPDTATAYVANLGSSTLSVIGP